MGERKEKKNTQDITQKAEPNTSHDCLYACNQGKAQDWWKLFLMELVIPAWFFPVDFFSLLLQGGRFLPWYLAKHERTIPQGSNVHAESLVQVSGLVWLSLSSCLWVLPLHHPGHTLCAVTDMPGLQRGQKAVLPWAS